MVLKDTAYGACGSLVARYYFIPTVRRARISRERENLLLKKKIFRSLPQHLIRWAMMSDARLLFAFKFLLGLNLALAYKYLVLC